jgi:formylglycine-generating enzyme required for sulfatase activity
VSSGGEQGGEQAERAWRILEDFLAQGLAGGREGLEGLCREHPELGAELRLQYEEWAVALGMPSVAGTVGARLREKIGDAAGDGGPDLGGEAPGPGRTEAAHAREVGETGHGAGTSDRDTPSSLTTKRLAGLAGRESSERYQMRGEVARGGMGTILKVWDQDLRRDLAMKVLRGGPPGEEDQGLLVRFVEEAQVSGQLNHPGVVPIHELGIDAAGRVYFTMQLVQGRTLKEVFELAEVEAEGWTQTRALGSLLRVCETMAYAHSKGVIHRDLKPANVMVGRFGETYVMDWGLAKVLGRDDQHDLRLQSSDAEPLAMIQTDRQEDSASHLDAPIMTMDGTVIGTPFYMPPEQAGGELERVGMQSDVYAVGAMLYQLLTGNIPYCKPDQRPAPHTVLAMVLQGPPKPIHALNETVPAELTAICEKAMSREIGDRYTDMGEMAEDLRAYLEQRVVRAYRTGALAEFTKWVARNRIVAVTIAAAMLVAFGSMAWISHAEGEKRKQTELAADMYSLPWHLSEADALWPALPPMVGAMEQWLVSARALVDRMPVHRADLENLQKRGAVGPDGRWHFTDEADQTLYDTKADLFTGLVGLGGKSGLVAEVALRLEAANTIRQRSIDDHRGLWDEALRSIADANECPAYGGLSLVSQVGLVPVGRDGASGLWEFAFLPGGDIPSRDKEGRLVVREGDAPVLVLIPGGTFWMGAQGEDPGQPNYDPAGAIQEDEGPVTEVTLAPFFLSKYELTQAQWILWTGHNPSLWHPGSKGMTISSLHPVEQVSWDLADRILTRQGLRLPTEAQWEYAARAGTRTPWWTGADRESLRGAINLADQSAKEGRATWSSIDDWPDARDGWVVHAPVGSFLPNPFGLHEIVGNVKEWCLDSYHEAGYKFPARPGDGLRKSGGDRRSYRDGSFAHTANHARAANRQSFAPHLSGSQLGLRPARSIDS